MTPAPQSFESFDFHVATSVDPAIVLCPFIWTRQEPLGPVVEVGWLALFPNEWQVRVAVLVPERQIVAAEPSLAGQHHDLTVGAKAADVVSVVGPDGARMRWGETDELRDQPVASVLSLMRMIAQEGVPDGNDQPHAAA